MVLLCSELITYTHIFFGFFFVLVFQQVKNSLNIPTSFYQVLFEGMS